MQQRKQTGSKRLHHSITARKNILFLRKTAGFKVLISIPIAVTPTEAPIVWSDIVGHAFFGPDELLHHIGF